MDNEHPMIHFHVHSEYSFDGIESVQTLFRTGHEFTQPAIAITDHNNVFAWYEMMHEALRYKVKPIFGIELNVECYHMVLLAQNEKGLENIVLLNNLAYEKKGSPFVTESELFQHKEGIFFLSGCAKGKLPSLLKLGKKDAIAQTLLTYQRQFGDHFFVEMQRYHEKQEAQIKQLLQLAKDAAIGVIPTNDVHYVNRENFIQYQQYIQLKTNDRIAITNAERFFKTKEEMLSLFPEKILARTNILEKGCKANAFSFFKEQTGDISLPIAKIYRYDDALAIRKVLYHRKKYELGTFLYNQIKKEQMCLSDIYAEGTLKEEIAFAKQLKGKIIKIEKHPHLFIRTNEHFPYFKKSDTNEKIAQIEEHTAQLLGLDLLSQESPYHTTT